MKKDASELNSIFINEDINTLFQTIINLKTGETIGYEALSRGPKDSILNMPKELFSVADKYNKNYELEILCLKKALSRYSFVKEKLFVNINLETIEDPVFKMLGLILLERMLNHSNIPINHMVMEINASNLIKDYEGFQRNIGFYRKKGYQIGIDDIGTDLSNLMEFIYITPDYLKIGIQLVKDIDKNEINQKKVSEIMNMATIEGIEVIAEGIEKEVEFEYLKSIGMCYGQGFYIQRPKSLDSGI
jgi:EAL domain-containing protein (putative c-di-GMP-specific phosphodiesterase class I)